LRQAEKAQDARSAADLRYRLDLMKLDVESLEKENSTRLHGIRHMQFVRGTAGKGQSVVLQLLTAALMISLVAFMESISMAKAMASKNKQRIDPNQELIGQGLAAITQRLGEEAKGDALFSNL